MVNIQNSEDKLCTRSDVPDSDITGVQALFFYASDAVAGTGFMSRAL